MNSPFHVVPYRSYHIWKAKHNEMGKLTQSAYIKRYLHDSNKWQRSWLLYACVRIHVAKVFVRVEREEQKKNQTHTHNVHPSQWLNINYEYEEIVDPFLLVLFSDIYYNYTWNSFTLWLTIARFPCSCYRNLKTWSLKLEIRCCQQRFSGALVLFVYL